MERERSHSRGTRGDRTGHSDPRDFNRALRRLKKEFQRDVLPAVKRARYHLSKSERRREKERKAMRRLRRQQRKEARYR
ncbi:MAG: hypothetical protein Kow0092_05840 [Deferrisomatales bacterium]